MATTLDGIEARLEDVELAFLPGWEGVDLRLTTGGPSDAVTRRLDRAEASIAPLLGGDLYGHDEDDLAAIVVAELRRRRQRLAVAESCTGGLIGWRVTEIPGSSEVFVGGIVAYANEVKTRDLGVPPDILERHGAVSEEVVRHMLDGAVRRLGVESAVAVTGIAGPEGGTDDKPVGTVWIGARIGDEVRTLKRRLPGDRQDIRQRAAQAALDLLRRTMMKGNG